MVLSISLYVSVDEKTLLERMKVCLSGVPHHPNCLAVLIPDTWDGDEHFAVFEPVHFPADLGHLWGGGYFGVSVGGTPPFKLSGSAHSGYLGW